MKHQPFLFASIMLLLAFLADYLLLEELIGMSYSVFLAIFYGTFFYLFRKNSFTNKQIGGLVFASVWLLSISYTITGLPFFNVLNLLLIPVLVFIHLVLITGPSAIAWHTPAFLLFLGRKIAQMFRYGIRLVRLNGGKTKNSLDKTVYGTIRKVAIGILIAIPLLFVVLSLLTSADMQFARMLASFPGELLNFNTDLIFRGIRVAIIAIVFLLFFKTVWKKPKQPVQALHDLPRNWDHIITITVLVLVNLVYLLFTVVQFRYFFSGSLEAGFSYAEYARRGFFELILVTIINFAILLTSLTFVKRHTSIVMKGMLTLLIGFSGIMLISSFMRLMLYEEAYGFTRLRILAHSFMIFLAIILLYTLFKVWIERLSLARFYLISALFYYVGLNIIGIDQIIVSNNIDRYEQTGKIDIAYLGLLSDAAVPELVALYEEHPEIPGLSIVLKERQNQLAAEQPAWQSYSFVREKAKESLEQFKF